jgi:hypothetical protein
VRIVKNVLDRIEGFRQLNGRRHRGGQAPAMHRHALASIFDMKMARDNSPSFDKFYRDMAWLLDAPVASGS